MPPARASEANEPTNSDDWCRPAPGARRRRRHKSPAAAGALLAPPRPLLSQSGSLQLGPDAALQVELAEQELRQRAERVQNGGGHGGPASTAPLVLPPQQNAVVAVPPELSRLLQRAPKQKEGGEQQKEQQPKQQADGAGRQPRQKKQRRARSAGCGSGSSARKKAQRHTITPKGQDLLAWYKDATAAAEHAHKQAGRGGAPAGSMLGQALVRPIQVGLRALLCVVQVHWSDWPTARSARVSACAGLQHAARKRPCKRGRLLF